MIKLIICLTLTQISVECCSTSEPERPRPPAVPGFISSVLCAHKFFKEYRKNGNLMSKLPDDKRIGELSIVGTRESISYLLFDKNDNRRRQEINIKTQLQSGVRFLDVTLYLSSGILMVSVADLRTDKTFGEFIFDVNLFLSYHKFELVFIKFSVNELGDSKTDLCDFIKEYRDNNLGGSRLEANWGLNDTLGMHRGRILLASEDDFLKNCTFSLKTCSRFSNINAKINIDNLDTYVDREWSEYLIMVQTSFIDEYKCNLYDLSIKTDYFPVKNVSKYGGFHTGVVNSAECVKPINFKLWKYYPKSNSKELNVVIVDYVIQEVIDRINQENYVIESSSGSEEYMYKETASIIDRDLNIDTPNYF